MQIQVPVEHPDAMHVLILPNENLLARSVSTGNAIGSVKDGTLTVLIANASSTDQVIPRGITIGTIEPLEEQYELLERFDNSARKIDDNFNENQLKLSELDIGTCLSQRQTSQVEELLSYHSYAFPSADRPLGLTDYTKMHIETPGANPISTPPYRTSFAEKKVIQEHLEDMLSKDVIEPSYGPWASPVCLVKKKTNDLRFVVDFRKLNAVTTKMAYPIPRIDDILDLMSGMKFFTTLDMKSGYWQVPLDRDARSKTGFIAGYIGNLR